MNKRRLTLLTACLAAFAIGSPAWAADELSSSMQANCLDLNCTQVRFTLDVEGSVFLSDLVLRSLDATIWSFGGLVAVFDANGNDVTAGWLTEITVDEIRIVTETEQPSADPVSFVVNMIQPPNGTQEQLAGNVKYFVFGYEEVGPDGTGVSGTQIHSEGMVTPEPVSLLLLGTGLAGLTGAGAVRRRRREDEAVEAEE